MELVEIIIERRDDTKEMQFNYTKINVCSIHVVYVHDFINRDGKLIDIISKNGYRLSYKF